MVRFSEDLIWYGKDFQILGEGISNFSFQILLDLNLEFRFSLHFSRVGRFIILSMKMSFMKLGLISLRVLKISINFE